MQAFKADRMEISGRFSQHARRAMLEAHQCAVDQHHIVVDTSHLLVGILHAEGSIGQRVLLELNLTPASLNGQLATLHPRRASARLDQPMTDALRATLRFAVEESRLLGGRYIGTEHLLLGLARGGGGQARQLLYNATISLDQIRRQVRRVLQAGETEIGLEKAVRLARLSELTRRVLSRATLIADDLDQSPVDLLHLLLALAQEARSPASQSLHACGLNVTALETAARQQRLANTNSLEEVLDEAVFYAERTGCHYTGTDHLILTLTQHHQGAALLAHFEVDVPRLHRTIEAQLQNRMRT